MSAEIALVPMTRELIHRLYREFENDPDIYADMQYYTKYVYNQQAVDRRFDALQGPERVVFAILHGGAPIGELQLKRINRERGDCTLSTQMQTDKVKNRGVGTEAEKLAIRYAFDVLKLDAVNADAILKNTRSQHVLEKAGFTFCREDETFRYYRAENT